MVFVIQGLRDVERLRTYPLATHINTEAARIRHLGARLLFGLVGRVETDGRRENRTRENGQFYCFHSSTSTWAALSSRSISAVICSTGRFSVCTLNRARA